MFYSLLAQGNVVVNVLYCLVSHTQRTPRRTARVRLKKESKIDDPWKLLDPYEPMKAENKPFRKGRTLVIIYTTVLWLLAVATCLPGVHI